MPRPMIRAAIVFAGFALAASIYLFHSAAERTVREQRAGDARAASERMDRAMRLLVAQDCLRDVRETCDRVWRSDPANALVCRARHNPHCEQLADGH